METFVPRDVLGTNVYKALGDLVQIVEVADAKHMHKLPVIVERRANGRRCRKFIAAGPIT